MRSICSIVQRQFPRPHFHLQLVWVSVQKLPYLPSQTTISHDLARQKECRAVEGHLMLDHVHVCIEISPKYSVASVVGFFKGKSAMGKARSSTIAIARQFSGKQRNFNGENFWARGYAISTIGFELEAVRRCIRDQDIVDKGGQF